MNSYDTMLAMKPETKNARINMLGPWLENEFGEKTVKLSLDGSFTCPNRDGTVGYGGCSFCSGRGSGDNASALNAIESQIKLLSDKWPNAKSFIAYFQNYTGTYAPVEKLRELYYSALSQPGVRGLAIATRPDCLSAETLDLLDEINKKHFLWVELGLQTIHDETAAAFGRGYKTEVYYDAVRELDKRNIKVVTHLILGLPGETREDMIESVKAVTALPIWGLKLHLLNIVKGTRLAEEQPDYVPFDSLLEVIPPDVVMHRLSADSPAELLIAPKWAYRKRLVLNLINAEMARRGSIQGCKL